MLFDFSASYEFKAKSELSFKKNVIASPFKRFSKFPVKYNDVLAPKIAVEIFLRKIYYKFAQPYHGAELIKNGFVFF